MARASRTTQRCRMRRPPSRLSGRSASTRPFIEEGLPTYPGLPHRMERVREKDGVLFVNDSKATNADRDRAGARRVRCGSVDFGRAGEERQSRRMRAAFRPCAQSLYHWRGGRIVRAALVSAYGGGRVRDAGRGGAIRGRRSRSGGYGVAVAGLRVVRPVQGLRGAGRPVPRVGGGVMIGMISGKLKASPLVDPNRYGRSDRSEAGPLVLGDRPAAAAAGHRADRDRADRGRRRLAGRGAALFGRQRDLLAASIISIANWCGSRPASR